ncbi:DotU family type IV/VI secretion system protein [Trinickia caryophylli]|uniref:Type VI secretion system protein ImpK n=1 Tax=Trinickia caryophylli TaxID=28094 RepID=A0A1X7G1V2_TRICW|nr:DotU family type IV/VI secretion system protein [Trinickia caryophylli]PMS13680.1 DotU family type IV/VI secretion system protein [Trinickia caryophylli]TRX14173.1 DotU family type IV/VI secretion system protein [Trinickia caryophylli]WQE13997.1 DotU family type IV/VI secretion system protein [Trinickia caryophylli]SMF62491.1 type VI secretion system protein ImpK [Trinickia caryophylli]GLU33522.1 hypothetical protein Busp01_33640 [Trinickia caryophylli]
MNALTSHRHETALLEAGGARASSPGMRALLRDTALLVTSLATGGAPGDGQALRSRCRDLIEQFSQALEQRGYPDDVRREAVIAQCGLLDETALRSLDPALRADWERKPLQVERFNLHDAGERVIEQLEARMRDASSSVDLLEGYSAILGMGFVGRYARDGESKRTALIASLNAQLETRRSSAAQAFVVDRPGRRFSDWLHRLSPWAIAGLACIAAGVLWVVWATALDAQVAHLALTTGVRP